MIGNNVFEKTATSKPEPKENVMFFRKFVFSLLVVYLTVFDLFPKAFAAEQPVAIFHAFNQKYSDVTNFVCTLADQGYSHIQISPAQKSNPDNVNSNPKAPVNQWAGRYQPVDYEVIEGLGSEKDLKSLVDKAHSCKIKVIADVVFNHMASMTKFSSLTNFPEFPDPVAKNVREEGSTFFHKFCKINYNDNKRDTEVNCWLADALPDSTKKI